MLFVSLVLVAAGMGLGVLIYRSAGESDPLARSQPALFGFLENKMWIDELYAATIVAFARFAARFSDWMDRNVWDGIVRALGGIGQLFGSLTKGLDERGINAGVDESAFSTRGIGRLMSALHTGQIQFYMGCGAIGMLGLLLLYAWLG
jgi:NADH:ubiquinone oxidoreductase subunit 5 (subunit L)/multisubunit Na+/H+ antiporter MnhA subunit